jgi:hypothetical protein
MMHPRSVRGRAMGGAVMDDSSVSAVTDSKPDGRGIRELAKGFFVVGVLALVGAILQAPDFVKGYLDINVLAPIGGQLRILPTAPPAALCLLGAAGLWKRQQFGRWAAWMAVVALLLGAVGLALLALVVIGLTGTSFMGSSIELAYTIGPLLLLGFGALVAGAAAVAITRTLNGDTASFRNLSLIDFGGAVVLFAAMSVTTAGPATVAPDPFLPYSSPAASGQPDWKFGIGVTQAEIGSAPIPNAPSGEPQVARVVTSLVVHLELEPGSDLRLAGPLRLCLRYDTGGNAALPLCWGGDQLAKLVNTQIGAPSDTADPWVMTPATNATVDATLARDPAACDYPPGPWMLEVFAMSPDKAIGQIYVTARVDVPAEGPQATVGPKVTSQWLCLHASP